MDQSYNLHYCLFSLDVDYLILWLGPQIIETYGFVIVAANVNVKDKFLFSYLDLYFQMW